MAIGISSTANSALGGAGGFAFETQRAAIAARRREAFEAREEPATDATARSEREEAAAPVQRVGETTSLRETRQDRVRLSQVTDNAQRPAIAAYLGVERATPSDPSLGELLGIDIYV